MIGRRLELDLVWQDAVALLRHNPRYGALVLGLFVVLPGLAQGWFGPDQAAILEAALAQWNDRETTAQAALASQWRWWGLAQYLLSTIGSVALLHGWLTRTPATEATLLRATARTALPALAVAVLAVLAIGVGMALLILPGLFLLGRLSLGLPALIAADQAGGRVGVIDSLRRSFAVTRGNVVRIVAMVVAVTILWQLAGGLLTSLIAVVANLVGGADFMRWVVAIPAALVAAVGIALMTAITAALWRQLAPASGGDL